MSGARARRGRRFRDGWRRCFGMALACAFLLSLVASCQRGGGENRLRHGNRLVTATISDPKTFNPILAVDAASGEAVGDLFDGLVRLNPRTTLPEPQLAERWEYDTTGTIWTFHLRHDVQWHDGVTFTAADVAFTFEAIYDPKVPNSSKHVLTVGGEPIRVEVVDPYTIRLRLKDRFAPLLNSIGFPILPKHVLGKSLQEGTFAQQWGIDIPPGKLIGTGPYRMSRYVPAQFIHYQRNPSYWMRDEQGGQLPRLPERTVLIVPDQNTVYLKFLDHQLHLFSPRPEEIDDVAKRREQLTVSLDKIGLDTGMLFLGFNRNPAHYAREGRRDPRLRWFTDPIFLRAVAHSIDAKSMIQNTFFGYGEPAVSSISPENTLFYNPHLQPYTYDSARARALLAEGGYVDRDHDGVLEDADGNRIEFELATNAGNQTRERLCSILTEDLRKLGMRVNYRPLEFSTLVERLSVNFDWDAIVMGFTGGVEPNNSANLFRSSGNLHLWHPNQEKPATTWEAEIDHELDLGARELDVEARRPHYWRIQEILHRELPMIQLVHQQRFIAYKSYLVDFHPTVWGFYRPERIALQP